MARIEPTVGRVVHVRNYRGCIAPLAGIISAIIHPANGRPGDWVAVSVLTTNPDRPVDVLVLPLIQEGEEFPKHDTYAEWMPFQKGQAAKTEELEKQIAGAEPVSARNNLTLDQRIAAKPWAKVTPEDVNNAIAGALYYVFPGTTLTVCCIKLVNGFTVTGEAAATHPGNFDAKIGQELAFADAKRKIWPLLGYTLRDRLYQQEVAK